MDIPDWQPKWALPCFPLLEPREDVVQITDFALVSPVGAAGFTVHRTPGRITLVSAAMPSASLGLS